MAEAKKRERNFERSYSDNTGEIEISQNGEPVLSVALDSKEAKPAEGDTPEQVAVTGINADVLRRAGMRYITDILVGSGNAALKAEGGTAEKAVAKMEETLKALQDGTYKFRAASGDGGLSLEDEQKVIADVLVTLGKATDAADGLAKVQAVYARSKSVERKTKDDKGVETSKMVITRPDYNQLRAVPQIKVALAQASKAENNLDELLSI